MASDPAGPRVIRDENGDVLCTVREENPGTMFRALIAEGRGGTRRLLEYPEQWRRLTDVKLYRLCQSGERLDG